MLGKATDRPAAAVADGGQAVAEPDAQFNEDDIPF